MIELDWQPSTSSPSGVSMGLKAPRFILELGPRLFICLVRLHQEYAQGLLLINQPFAQAWRLGRSGKCVHDLSPPEQQKQDCQENGGKDGSTRLASQWKSRQKCLAVAKPETMTDRCQCAIVEHLTASLATRTCHIKCE